MVCLGSADGYAATGANKILLRQPLVASGCTRQQHETPADDPMHPPTPKKFRAEVKAAAKTRARRGLDPFSPRASPTGGGHPARSAGCGAHARSSASLQHHDGYGRDFSHGARAPCFQCAKGYTFWAPLLWTLLLRSAAAPCVLDKPVPTACACHVTFFYFHRVLAAASPLRALPRQCQRYFSTGNGTPGCAPTASGGYINVRAPPPWFL